MFLMIFTGVFVGGCFAVALILLFLHLRGKFRSDVKYRVAVKFAHGIKTKLTLNQAQYEQFRAWLERPEGIWDIGDDNAFVSLDRQYVASVEVRKK